MNSKLAAVGIYYRWELDTDSCSNSVGSWFCADLGGVTDAKSMREHTAKLIASKAANPGVAFGEPAEVE